MDARFFTRLGETRDARVVGLRPSVLLVAPGVRSALSMAASGCKVCSCSVPSYATCCVVNEPSSFVVCVIVSCRPSSSVVSNTVVPLG
jgi:hypothetical protein